MTWLAPLLVLLIPLAGCGDDVGGSQPNPAGAVLTYRFQDASVPPEHHRSYTLELTGAADGARGDLVVDSYGDELVRVGLDVPVDMWAHAVAELTTFDPGTAQTEGCAGGTGREVELRTDGATLTSADIEVCGGEGHDVADELDAVIAPLLAGIDMEALLATG